jgi:hypothetical protein
VIAMQRLILEAELRGTSTPPAGEPPRLSVRSRSTAVRADWPIDSIGYETDVTFTGEATFTETGSVRLGGDSVRVTTLGEGNLRPTGEDGLLQGAVVWAIDGGSGRFAHARGLLTSNFVLDPQTGDVEERQTAVIFVAER